ncbi:hypothetical protein [Ligilactobacillus apodemi]|uniref:hypothetical protein n=1 Tax=Ligilactobacillus apodemi TaxID=307126 RepID=UPI00214CB80D|nr:hypothetical protein [Ligilactobacillus apodemi]
MMRSSKVKLALFALATTFFAVGVTEFISVGVLPAIAQEFQISTSTAGLITTMYALGVALGAPVLTLVTSGFDKERLFYTQGDYGLFQCSVPCHNETYDNEAIIKKMVEQQKDMKIPTELIPKCPKCGADMTMNLRIDNRFVEDEGWHKAQARYEKFLAENEQKKIVYLELGVGMNTPGIIKYPFLQMTSQNPQAEFITFNAQRFEYPVQLEPQIIQIVGDIAENLSELVN